MTEIVLGPPGTGKTRTLLSYVDDALRRKVPSEKIGYVSFTRKAADEAITRACEQFNLTRADLPHFRTLHSLCFQQLGLKRADVLEGPKLQEFASYAGIRISGRWSEDGTMVGFDVGDRILFMENLARIRGIPLRDLFDEFDDRLNWRQVAGVAADLIEFKKQHGLMDFTDMLQEYLRSNIRLGLLEVFGDEMQDFSHLQWQVFGTLAQGAKRVAVAGDDDQAIYRWAGADVDHLIDMEGDVRVLGQSWRVPPAIQRVANEIISNVRHRREKPWTARTGAEGEIDEVTSFEEVDCGVGQMLVLARNAYVIKEQIIPRLRAHGIVYERHGHSSIKPALLESIRDWEMLRKNDKVEVARVRKIYEWMSMGRGYTRGHKTLPGRADDELVSIAELREKAGLLTDAPWHEAMDRLPLDEVDYIRAARQRGEKLSAKPRVVLSTIHGAKGGEADHVVIMKEMAQRTFQEMKMNEEDEARVWYVGVTRAREKLTVVESSRPQRSCPWL